MKTLILAIAASALIAAAASPASADPEHGGDQGRHNGWAQDQGASHQWKRGQHMGYNDWQGAQPVDYRQHHLRQPPRGYEWRQSNGQYVLAAVATGLVASIILNNGR